MCTYATSIFKAQNVAKRLSCIHNKHVVLAKRPGAQQYCFMYITVHKHADNRIRYRQFTWQINNIYPNETYEKVNHGQSWVYFVQFGILIKDEKLYLPSLYCRPQLLTKQRVIARSPNVP